MESMFLGDFGTRRRSLMVMDSLKPSHLHHPTTQPVEAINCAPWLQGNNDLNTIICGMGARFSQSKRLSSWVNRKSQRVKRKQRSQTVILPRTEQRGRHWLDWKLRAADRKARMGSPIEVQNLSQQVWELIFQNHPSARGFHWKLEGAHNSFEYAQYCRVYLGGLKSR